MKNSNQIELQEQTKESKPKDISHDFITMDVYDFVKFIKECRNEPFLSIAIDWRDVSTARRLKAFVDQASRNQRRVAKIRATRSQMNLDVNAFASGVEWEEVEESD